MTTRLNIGAGDVKIDGFTPIDRKHGTEAYPLEYESDSVDEIRASHILDKPPAIACQATLPRYGSHVAMQSIYTAFADCGLRIYPSFGAYWHECMERDFEAIVNDGTAEWIYTVDSDSMITSRHVGMLVKAMLENPEMDALCAVQPKRQADERLTSHFGLTILKAEPLRSLPKPWFQPQPSPANDWNDGRIEADRYFWAQWMKHGYRVANIAQCRIGHLEERIAFFDDNDEYQCVPVQDWLECQSKP